MCVNIHHPHFSVAEIVTAEISSIGWVLNSKPGLHIADDHITGRRWSSFGRHPQRGESQEALNKR